MNNESMNPAKENMNENEANHASPGATSSPPPVSPPGSLVDRLLRQPRQLREELDRQPLPTSLALIALMAACFTAYGLVVGSFSGSEQYWMAPAKILIAALLSALICWPSLHILACLEGGRQTMHQSGAALLMSVALTGLLLIGFAPVAWVFSQSTNAGAFMGLLHLSFLICALRFGMRLLRWSLADINGERAYRSLGLWVTIFVLVCFQMCTAARPLVGPFNGYQLAEKKFFVMHWIDAIDGRTDR